MNHLKMDKSMKEKTNAQIAFDQAVKEIHERLKPLGFKKKSLNFIRQKDEMCQLINIQKSMYNSGYDICFTINVCVGKVDKDESCRSIHDFEIRERIGQIKQSGDFWYHFDEQKDIFTRKQKYQSETHLALEDITKHALPFLDSFKSKEDIECFYE